ncbi:unnamed protein product [Mesocestoides corti]|uniref:RNA helicase n=1 Tax=Mesocestoides corti TaxID=53468 RepID=A0A0R3U359_MESCO|nr:unnamed protein product [Mesocestoides corti]
MAEKLVEDYLLDGKYDESNPLVLPSKKSKQKKGKTVTIKTERILSRSKRKLLQKQVAKKQKKLTSKNWCQPVSSSANSSVDTDDFTSTEEFEPEDTGPTSTSKTCEAETLDGDLHESPSKSDLVKPVEVEISKPVLSETRVKTKYVLVNRSPEIQTSRLALPIVAEEANIMEKISENDVVIICGATGCGKTTQVPQFLYEAGYARDGYKIGVTEPRRVAAISMSERVSEELGLRNGEIGYHIRYEKNVSQNTIIKFMTDGILLQEMKKDFQLSSYSAIVIDEAHERSVYTDVLLGLLSLVTRLRRRAYNENPSSAVLPLKLIVMSATLRVEDFADNRQLFPTIEGAEEQSGHGIDDDDDDEEKKTRPGAPPVLKVGSRQFPVTCHFSRCTPDDYLKAAFRKVVSIHKDSPPGGILVFLTGQREVRTLCDWLTKAFPASKVSADTNEDAPERRPTRSKAKRRKRSKADVEAKPENTETTRERRTQNQEIFTNAAEAGPRMNEAPSISRFNLDNFDIIPVDEETELGLGSGSKRTGRSPTRNVAADADDTEVESDGASVDDALDDEVLRELRESDKETPDTPICALPLYSLLPADQQRRVFEPPPEGQRLVVVATNVAETSLTIPNIRYVVDTGKVKSKIYDAGTGASCFRIVWISQASAVQRAGRAGRIGPGHCYRLYSSRVFGDDMAPFSAPDILTRPIDEVVLLLKSYLGSTPLSRFPLPTPPSANSVEAAERRLTALGALEEKKNGLEVTRTITRAGRWMARLPLPARFARMLLFANQHNLMPYAVVLVAVLSVPDFFLVDSQSDSPATTDAMESGKKRKRGNNEADKLAQIRTNFFRQFVKTEGDLMLGDLAVLIGSVCCFERYWGQLIGTIPADEGSALPSIVDRVSRVNPEATMRQLVQKCGVRWKAYLEVRQLRLQLTDILNANVPDLNLQVEPALAKPTPTQVEQLRQLFLVGSVCHLAAKFDLPVEGLPVKDRRRLRYAYKAKSAFTILHELPSVHAGLVPGVSDPVFVDPNSPLARENCTFLAYTELHTSSKPFLRNVCAINPAWIPFLAPHSYRVEGITVMESTPVESSAEDKTSSEETKPKSSAAATGLPAPYYDPERDSVMAYAKRVFFIGSDLANADISGGDPAFDLPSSHVPIPLHAAPAAACIGVHEALVWSVRWFARSLLEGKVYTKELAAWFPKRLKTSTPTRMITLSWGLYVVRSCCLKLIISQGVILWSVRPEVRDLVSKMLGKKVISKRTLEACLSEDAQFLSKELTAWLPSECHADFQSKWPPCTKINEDLT